eukprot:245316-Rhodomonas_salina.1
MSCSNVRSATDADVRQGFIKGAKLMIGVTIESQNQKHIGHSIRVPMSGRYSIHTAIKESIPTARVVMDIIDPPAAPLPRRFRLAAFARSASSVFLQQSTRQRIKIDSKGNNNFVALMGTLQVLAMQCDYAFKATLLSPEPKHQHEARKRPDAQDWIDSEWVEMDTIYRMGTITYVKNCDLPIGTTTIPTKFVYKCKFGAKGKVIKKKG